MTSPIIEAIEKEQIKKKSLPPVNVGDKVCISLQINEGKKQRVQQFEGIVIDIKKRLSRKSITVRKLVDSVGVEKTFLLYSPLVTDLKIIKAGKVRRAKLFYLRDRIGSAATTIKARKTYSKSTAKLS